MATQGRGNAKEKVMNDFFDFVGSRCISSIVRSENTIANKFYEKVGMKQLGYITTWSDGKMPERAWQKSI